MKFTKEKKDEEIKEITVNEKSTAKSTTSKNTTKKETTKSSTSKNTTKKETTKSSTSKSTTKNKDTKSSTSKSTTKKEDTTKSSTSKSTVKKETAKSPTSKNTTKKGPTTPFKSTLLSRNKTKKIDVENNTIDTSTIETNTISTKKITNTNQKKLENEKNQISKKSSFTAYNEYYDLPYRYNQTIIKILAQTPHSIFVYWDISDDDRAKMRETYGPHVFEDTIPVLLVHNNTTNYSYLIEINDFANSWYIKTPTADCSFTIELGRKKIENRNETKIQSSDNIVHITTSNNLMLPNDRFLIETLSQKVFFKNIKNNKLEEANITDLTPINQVYKYYKNDILNNPSSNFKF